jgi:L-histidine N-alpha-methyltransferase
MRDRIEVVSQREDTLRDAYADDVRAGFSRLPYEIPTKYLYDRQGSLLFDEFAATSPNYYPHAEGAIVDVYREGLRAIMDVDQIIELGAGSCPRLVQFLKLGLISSSTRYRAVDVCPSPMVESLNSLEARYPQLNAVACVGDFETWTVQAYADIGVRSLILWLGNTAANTTPSRLTATLRTLRRSLRPDTQILLGIDLSGIHLNVGERFPDEHGAFARFRWNALNR